MGKVSGTQADTIWDLAEGFAVLARNAATMPLYRGESPRKSPGSGKPGLRLAIKVGLGPRVAHGSVRFSSILASIDAACIRLLGETEVKPVRRPEYVTLAPSVFVKQHSSRLEEHAQMLIAALLFAVSSQVAVAQPVENNVQELEPKQKAADEEVICRRKTDPNVGVGRRGVSRKVCKTRAEWAAPRKRS